MLLKQAQLNGSADKRREARRARFYLIFFWMFSLWLLSALGYAQNFSLPASEKIKLTVSSSPLRAVQISVLEFENLAQFGDWLSRLKTAGINTVIIKVFHNPGDRFHKLCVPQARTGFYFKGDGAPLVCDLVGSLAEEAREKGIRFYAWMNSRSADYGLESRRDLHSWSYDPGLARYQSSGALCIFHPEARAHLLALYQALASYPIDGILVQDDLMMRQNEDFHPLALHLYTQEQGKRLSPEKFYQLRGKGFGKKLLREDPGEFQEWTEWKVRKLLEFADQLQGVVKAQNPEIKFGFNFYYETALKPEHGRAWFAQDLKMASAHPYDFYPLMLYHRQMKEELGISGENLENAIEDASQNFLKLISVRGEPVFKLMTKDFKSLEPIPEAELLRIIKLIPDRNRAGLIFFPLSPGEEILIIKGIRGWEEGG